MQIPFLNPPLSLSLHSKKKEGKKTSEIGGLISAIQPPFPFLNQFFCVFGGGFMANLWKWVGFKNYDKN